LINPPGSFKQIERIKRYAPVIPLGLAYIAAVLEREKHIVHVIDAIAEGRKNKKYDNGLCTIGLSWSQILDRIKKFKPRLVGLGCPFSSRFFNALKIARIIKDMDPSIKVMIGGIHPSILPEDVLKKPEIDFVILGEGEVSTLEIVNNLEKGLHDFSCIDGIGYKEDGKIKINPKTKYVSDLDTLPFPARHLFPMNEYFKVRRHRRPDGRYTIRNVQRNSIISSRGCPFNCTFCSIHAIWGNTWRPRRPEKVVEEIKEMQKNYGIVEISFEDDNLTLDKNRMKRLCETIIKKNIKIKWDTPNGVSISNLDREVLTAMKKAGCYSLNLAIESGDPYILNHVIGKAHTIEKAREIVLICKEIGIKTLGYFVIGMPGETKESIQHSIDYATSLPLDDLNVFIATPYPGTKLYKDCIEHEFISEYNYEDFPADDDYQQKTAIINTPKLSADELLLLRKKFYDEFNESLKMRDDIL
jgi:magnesium-protoporphyrin IX monomethyl ester (oxidative) cyclase